MSNPAPDMRDLAAEMWPRKSEAWRDVWIKRAAWYVFNDGDMTGAPEFPKDEA